LRPRLEILAGAARDVRDSVRRARSRRQHEPLAHHPPPDMERQSADEVKRRLDETRARLRRQIPPRDD
jgi:hypothetical protein